MKKKALAGALALVLSTGAVMITFAAEATNSTANSPQSVKTFSLASYEKDAAQLPAGLAKALDRDLHISGAKYLEQSAAAEDGVSVVNSLEKYGVHVLGSRIDGTTVTVFVPTAADAARVAATGAVASIGAPAPADLSGITFNATDTVLDGTGIYWTQKTGGGWQCSVGFNGYSIATGANQLLTAGHCLASMDPANAIYELTQVNGPQSGGALGKQLGTALNSSGSFGNGHDSGLINVAGVTPAASVATWGRGTAAATSSAPLPVYAQSSAIVGAQLCKSGSRNGWGCGTIKYVDQNVTVNENGVAHTVNSIVANLCVIPGDSGGAALIGNTAVGITSGSNWAGACNANSFAAFYPMISAVGKSDVRSTYQGTWEPSITVLAPTVVSRTNSTSSTPAGFSGTLANPDVSSRVLLFIDNATTPAATASAANGKWSITFPAVKAGIHSFSLVATWGTWSRSIPVSGTVTIVAPNKNGPPTTTPTSSPSARPTTVPTNTPKPTPTAGITAGGATIRTSR